MTVENTGVVDIVGVSRESGFVILTMVEHRDWSDSATQLAQLREKASAYLEFVKSGQLYETHEAHRGAPIAIELVCQFPPPSDLHSQLRDLASQLSGSRVGFKVSVHPPKPAAPYEVNYNAS